MNSIEHADLIAIDWGTSHLRAYLCQYRQDNSLRLLATSYARGVTKVTHGFEQELFNCIAPWQAHYQHLPIIMAGQIGSSIGWQETTYLPCPISPNMVAQSCLHFTCRDQQLSIVPGLHCSHENNHRDVMRGEELQVLGWLAQDQAHQQGQHLICLPGTHTKWVLVDDGQVKLFKTAMTGELYDLLSHHSVLIQDAHGEFCPHAFASGAQYTLASALGSFIHGLFSARSKQLFKELAPEHATSYLSGMLIGSDVRAAINATEWSFEQLNSVSIIGNNTLSQRFSEVLTMQQIATTRYDVEAITLAGFASVYQQLLVGSPSSV
ncbi:2-dehydro-3-deoxygalactonokinase [Thalassotalea euphylliae]|uniref:2-dehydro-3-deoxygalactonokinase n=1 Tax=Thalassotalea euphylliae TaxID=1655234 RepID=A0A3E0U146_9GAMM|nr:2-dehydro-3-deoxygalactonokinase [Thalassotalea euphylliae]REL30658.1 2-dehydro-3-deoxygalactonokinase [Thalassotalea euphylliae]